jgi:hypothetical protein
LDSITAATLVHHRLAAAGRDDVCAGIGKAERQGSPNPRRPANHHRRLSLQVERHQNSHLKYALTLIGLTNSLKRCS